MMGPLSSTKEESVAKIQHSSRIQFRPSIFVFFKLASHGVDLKLGLDANYDARTFGDRNRLDSSSTPSLYCTK